MMRDSESCQEAVMVTPLLTSRRTTNIATWNIRTMFQARKAAQVAQEMENYRILLLGLWETQWKQSGQLQLLSSQTILYSGHKNECVPHTEDVAIMLSKEAQRVPISWEAVSPQIVTASFTTKKKNINITVIQCYAPMNDALDDKKEEFYDQLQRVVNRQSNKDITLLMGDLNAKKGDVNTGYEQVMGLHALGRMNENGELFADFCTQTVLSLEAVCSHTGAFIRQPGDRLIMGQKIRSTICVYVGSSGGLYRM